MTPSHFNDGRELASETIIRYKFHFSILAVATLAFWLIEALNLSPLMGVNLFGLMGLLHAASVVVSLRDRKTAHLLVRLCFIILAVVWSWATPILGAWTSVVWTPIAGVVPSAKTEIGDAFLFVTGSAIGASGYWLLVRLFVLRTLRLTDWLRTLALCMGATLLWEVPVDVLLVRFPHIGKRFSDDILFLGLTAAWWFAFSISLYWSEARRHLKTLPPLAVVPTPREGRIS